MNHVPERLDHPLPENKTTAEEGARSPWWTVAFAVTILLNIGGFLWSAWDPEPEVPKALENCGFVSPQTVESVFRSGLESSSDDYSGGLLSCAWSARERHSPYSALVLQSGVGATSDPERDFQQERRSELADHVVHDLSYPRIRGYVWSEISAGQTKVTARVEQGNRWMHVFVTPRSDVPRDEAEKAAGEFGRRLLLSVEGLS